MALTPTKKQAVRTAITDYCVRAEKNQRAWHYTQARPFHYVQNPAISNVAADCSGYVSMAFHAAMIATKVFIDDPLGQHYSGWGYTGTELEWLRTHGKNVTTGQKYFVGDMVIYGHSASNTVHTSICRTAGTDKTAVFSSNGNENAPQPTNIHYHPDPIVGVWRHPALL